ncbi:hypothetical protein BVRB_5g122950 isoform A [Beta vulgaris subsp. vulgaris]|uniref:HMA domain-containing protein n=1 Tax=Beta vulgaris subsp. vulgaris TaxID=3555 RepID=A0A0J8B970_BETVV|nr:hypothetical protein BVRB_5g122950 isoform A [Beta vulgaris subsp. vulgaris]
MKKSSAENFIVQKAEKDDKERVHNAVDMGTEKNQCLLSAEDLSIPTFQVIVMSANMGCSSCRDKVYRVLSKMTGFKEYTVDVRKKQVIIKGDVSFLWRTREEDT